MLYAAMRDFDLDLIAKIRPKRGKRSNPHAGAPTALPISGRSSAPSS
jgi:hypothetical protein